MFPTGLCWKTPTGNIADEVQYYEDGRWPEPADGGGRSLELRNPLADNSKARSVGRQQ